MIASALLAAVLTAAALAPPAAATPDVVGGRPTAAPWVVALVDRFGQPFCDGVHTAPATVTTAAHCLVGRAPDTITVVGGRTDLGRVGRQDAVSGVSAVTVPPDFVAAQAGGDVGTLTLTTPIPSPPLPAATTAHPPGTPATVYGYGGTGQAGAPLLLRAATVPILAPAACRQVFDRFVAGTRYDDRTMFCAGGQGAGICVHDDGGPLVVDGTLVGIASWHVGCGSRPDYYARVTGSQ
jgi:secreted trypsin-like serine protease